MIEGVRQERDTGVSSQSIAGDSKLGLSSTAHGYTGITPLAHVVFLLCSATSVAFLVKSSSSTGEPGYQVPLATVLKQSESSNIVQKWQEPINRAGKAVTGSCVLLNCLMMVRFLFEICCKGKANPEQMGSHRRLRSRNQMQAYSVGGQHEPLNQPIMKGQAGNYGFGNMPFIRTSEVWK
jgi:hypothetical protein